MTELLHAEGSAELVAGLHPSSRGAWPTTRLNTSERQTGLTDLLTTRILTHILADLDEMIRWGGEVMDAFIRAGEP
ncbi:MAG: hypothetical protein R3F14_44935 [Polyangiaceae bacterium]